MATWNEQLKRIDTLRLQRQANDDKLYATQIALQKIEVVLKKAEDSATARSASSANNPAGEKKRLEEEVRKAKADLEAVRTQLNEAITAVYVDPHPRKAVSNLEDSIPFLLMPVRIETRFMAGASPELWLRIYPDDIVVHTHEKTLTVTEVTEGEKYWKALFDAEKAAENEREDRKKAAWTEITKAFGPQRSAWVALQTKPLNWSNVPTLTASAELDFPVHDITKLSAWTRAPRAYELPDKFVVMLYEKDTIVQEIPGAVIPDELFLGPEPMDPDESFVMHDDMLGFGESFNWTSNFDKAIEKGMGFKIPITATQAANGFDKILVLGLTLSIDAPKGQENLEALIDNHHYSTKGFSIVPQGTPTNNTEQQGSGYTSNDPFNDTSYFVETGDPLFLPSTDCDGRNLAHALGIKYDPLQYVQHSDAADLKEAVAMNSALYASTLGYYFDTMLAPVLPEPMKQQLRMFATANVTGRGALPAFRVGDQPYGLLLTSDYSKWKWSPKEISTATTFFTGLQKVIDHYTTVWNSLATQAMYMGKPGTDPSEVMMNILGLDSGSVSFQQRVGYSTDDLKNRAAMQGTTKYQAAIERNFDSKNNVLNLLSGFGFNMVDANGNLRVPQLLRLVYQNIITELNVASLIDDTPLSEKEIIHFYDTAGEKNYIHWLRDTESVEVLRNKNFGTDVEAPRNLLFQQLLRSLLLELHSASNEWLKNQGIDFSSTRAVKNFHNIRGKDITKWEVMKGKVGIAVPTHAQKDMAVADFVLTAGSTEAEANYIGEVRNALDTLAELPTARLERCFTEHIDTCSYRLDAWQSAFFKKRLESQRNIAPGASATGDQNRRMGLYLGAFGWVEEVRPSLKRKVTAREQVPGDPATDLGPLFEYADNGGFVHTPSLNHAVAAAVLRSGYLNHASSAQPQVLSVNLSSQRIRDALFILDGIRNGQTLEALLGYQFERGLHDRGSQSDELKLLNAFIYNFREAFPLERHIVMQQGATTTTETIPATDVVNGLKLAEKEGDFPWGATGDVAAATGILKDAVIAERNKLQATLDGVKDLMLSESVYQLVQGNYDRGAAVMNCMKESSTPPDIEIHKTPRSSRFTFTNRITVQFDQVAPADATNPRCIMEAGMNKWMQTVLGDMSQLAFRVSSNDGSLVADMTVDQLGLQPIDLVYIAGDELNTGSSEKDNNAASELEKRIAHAFRVANGLGDGDAVVISFFGLEDPLNKKPLGEILPLLRTVKSLITHSRNLHAQDFIPASGELEEEQVNLKRYVPAELSGRIDGVMSLFDGALTSIKNLPVTLLESFDTLSGTVRLEDLSLSLINKGTDLAAVKHVLNNSDAATLITLLIGVSRFGLPDSFPQVSSAITEEQKLIILVQGEQVLRRMSAIQQDVAQIRTAAAALSDPEKKTDQFVKAVKLILGDSFNVLPVFTYGNPADVQHSSDENEQLLKHAREELSMSFPADEWLQNIAHVRPRLAVWDSVRTFSEMINDASLSVKPVQLPYRSNDSWIAVEFPAERKPGVPFAIDHDTLAITIHGDNAFNTGSVQSGIMIDEIVEMIPGKDEITGVAFNYNQPNAMPPQSLLLAVTPEEKGHWDWDTLVGILNNTLLRAKQRAVEPDMLRKSARSDINVLLPAILANFAESDLDLVLDYRSTLTFYAENSPVNIVAIQP